MHAFESHRQWFAVKQVYEKLQANGYQAWLAGGCVRDLLMEREPHDFDIATDAKPQSVEALFEKAVTVGREFGVTILPFGEFQVEVATFRKDGPYEDGRHPTHIVFCTPEEDAKRRDFTVNALFFDIAKRQVIDYVGGEADIKAGILRAVGDPDLRFDEDKLRILRAVRFSAQLDFTIEPKTFEAIKKRHQQVSIVAFERIRDELIKMLKSPRAGKGIKLLLETGLWGVVLPEMSAAANDASLIAAIEKRVNAGASSPARALLNLVFDFAQSPGGQAAVKALFKRLRASNSETEAVLWTLSKMDLFVHPSRHRKAELIRTLAHPVASLAEEFYSGHEALEPSAAQLWHEIDQKILGGRRQLPLRLINGEDLQKLGVAKGPELGRLLEEAFNRQLEGQLKTRDEALTWVQSQLS